MRKRAENPETVILLYNKGVKPKPIPDADLAKMTDFHAQGSNTGSNAVGTAKAFASVLH